MPIINGINTDAKHITYDLDKMHQAMYAGENNAEPVLKCETCEEEDETLIHFESSTNEMICYSCGSVWQSLNNQQDTEAYNYSAQGSTGTYGIFSNLASEIIAKKGNRKIYNTSSNNSIYREKTGEEYLKKCIEMFPEYPEKVFQHAAEIYMIVKTNRIFRGKTHIGAKAAIVRLSLLEYGFWISIKDISERFEIEIPMMNKAETEIYKIRANSSCGEKLYEKLSDIPNLIQTSDMICKKLIDEELIPTGLKKMMRHICMQINSHELTNSNVNSSIIGGLLCALSKNNRTTIKIDAKKLIEICGVSSSTLNKYAKNFNSNETSIDNLLSNYANRYST
jgi:transcription initiation factor TFIIIB Brf1 subunit/transcription initiation factor TFIIB